MTLEKTMVLAQRVYEEEALRAKKESDILLWEADKRAEKIIEGVRQEMLDTRQRIERLRLYEKQLYLKHKGFLDFQMELLDGYKDKETFFTDSDMDKVVGGARERDLLHDGGDQRDDEGGVIPDVVSIVKSDDDGDGGRDGSAAGGAYIGSINEGGDIADDAGPGAGVDGDDVVDEADEDTVYAVYDGRADGEESIPPEYRGLAGLRADAGLGAQDEAAKGAGRVEAGEAGSQAPDIGASAGEAAGEATGEAAGEATVEASGETPGEAADTDGGEPQPGSSEESPFVVSDEIKSMEQVVLLAHRMEEALKALDTMYGESDEDED